MLHEFIPPADLPPQVPLFRGAWDAQGVYVYQAYRDEIADWALEHQTFGGPAWKPTRMTWIKPSFAWMLYRSGYGFKPGQGRVLKIKLSHDTIAYLLSHCKLTDTNKDNKRMKAQHAATSKVHETPGRIQWDPERDLFQAEGNDPRRMLRTRAIQIGLAGSLSEYYVNHIISIEEVSDLAHRVAAAHRLKGNKATQAAMEALHSELPDEQPYMPNLPRETLCDLAMLPSPAADAVAGLGRGGNIK